MILLTLAVVHIAMVLSILLQERSVIWPLHNDTVHRRGRGADFYAVYHAGVNTRLGLSPYENDTSADTITPYWYAFRYPPIVATAGVLFTFLVPRAAYIIWILIVEACLVVLLVVLWRAISGLRLRIAATALLLLNSPYFLELYMGQFTFVALALCCIAILHPRSRLCFTASVLLKPLCLVAVPALAKERRYWLTILLAIACLLAVSVPYFLRHRDQWATFYEVNFRLSGGLNSGNYGLVYFLSLLAADLHIGPLLHHWDRFVSVFRVVVLAGTALIVLRSRKATVVTGAAALILAHFLTYQHVWEHHMSAVCVVGAMLLTVPGAGRWRYSAILACLFLLAVPSPFALFDTAKDPSVFDPSQQWPRYASYITVLSKVLPTAALGAIVMSDITRASPTSSPSPSRAETSWRLSRPGP